MCSAQRFTLPRRLISPFFAKEFRIPADRQDGHGGAAGCEGGIRRVAKVAGETGTTKERIGEQGRERREVGCGGKFGVFLETEN